MKFNKFKAFISLVLVLTLLFQLCIPVFAHEDEYDEEYQKILSDLEEERSMTNMAENYPDGIFSVAVPAVEVGEDFGEPVKLYVVRHGGTEGEATIKLKFNDYTAKYGKDYTVKLKDSIFAKKLKENEKSIPLMYLLGGEEEEINAEVFESYESMVEYFGQERVDEMIEIMEEEENTEDDSENEALIPNEIKDESPLMAFNNKLSMYSDDGVDKQDYLSENYVDPETAEMAYNLMEEILFFTETEVVFEDGEQIKEIFVYPENDRVSNGERTFAMVISAGDESVNVDSNNTSTVVIKDDEPNEVSNLYIDTEETPTEVQLGDKTFTAVLKRDSATYKTITANFFAVSDTNKVLTAGKVLLMPGMKTQKVEVKIDPALLEGASRINMYLSDGKGCEVSGDTVSADIMNGDTVALFSTSSGIVYTAENSPIGFAGEGTYDGFDIYPNQDNFQTDGSMGKDKDVENGYNGETWKLNIPNKTSGWKNSKAMIQSKHKLNFAVAESLEIDWERDDYSGSKRNRQIFSTHPDFHIDRREETYDENGGTYRFEDEYDGRVKINARTGSVEPNSGLLTESKYLTRMGSNTGEPGDAAIPSYMHFMIWKTSGGVNGSLMDLRNIHVVYRQYDFHINDADKINGEVPGALKILSRDALSISDSMKRYALEKISLSESFSNSNYELTGLQIKNGNEWQTVEGEFFDAKNRTFDFSDEFIQKYYKFATDDYTRFELKPVYTAKKVQVTVNTDETGGISINGENIGANSGSHSFTVEAGSTITIAPYDAQQGYSFSEFKGSKVDVNNSANSWNIEFQQNAAEQNLRVDYYNYVITPVYTAEGTFVRIDTPDGVPEGCAAPSQTFYSFANGDLVSGKAMLFYAEVADGYRAKWTVKNANHQWATRSFYGESFDYRVINGDNVIELRFEKMDSVSYAALNGTVVSYKGTILNPPVSNGMGGYLGEQEPLSNVDVYMGKYSAKTGADGKFRLYSYENASDDSGENTIKYLRAYPNEDHTVRVMCNNTISIYVISTGNGDFKSADFENPAEVNLEKPITTDFYGSGPTPSSIEVLFGADASSMPSISSQVGAVPMSDISVGFRLNMNITSSEYPISRVDFMIVAEDGAVRNTYSVPTQGTSTEYSLFEYEMKNDDGTVGTAYFNGLLNFKDGDKIYVDIIGTTGSGDASMDISYGKYDTGISFYEVPGQGIETVLPEISPEEDQIPGLEMVGTMLPRINFGPLSISAIINGNSMMFNVGFSVYELSKALASQKEKATPVKTEEEFAKEKAELDSKLEKGELTQEEYDRELEKHNTAVVANDLIVENEQDELIEEQKIIEPTADELANANETVEKNNYDLLKNVKGAAGLIKNLQERNKLLGGAGVKDALAKASGGIKLNANLTLGASFTLIYNTDLKDWVFESASIYASVMGAVSGTFYMMIPSTPIPCYIGFSVSITIGLYTGIGANYPVTLTEMSDGTFEKTVGNAFYFKGNVPVMMGIEIFVGVGIQRILSLQLTGGFLQQFNFAMGSGATGNGSTTFYGAMDISLVIFSGQWKFAQKSWNYSLYGQQAQMLNDSVLSAASDAMNMPLSNMMLIDETYANEFVGGENVSLMSSDNDSEDLLHNMILKDTQNIKSNIVPLGGDKLLSVFTATAEERSIYNRQAIYYTIFDGSSWSAPQLLSDEPTSDVGLHVNDLGDQVVISWSKSQKVFDENDFNISSEGKVSDKDILKFMSSTDVYTIVADKEQIIRNNEMPEAVKITNDYNSDGETSLGYAHQITGAVKVNDGRILMFYTSIDYDNNGTEISTLNELLSAPGIMMYRIYEDGQWLEDYYAEEENYAGIEDMYGQRLVDINLRDEEGKDYFPITGHNDIGVVSRNGEELVLISYIYDLDGDLLTSNDRAVCISAMKPDGKAYEIAPPIQLNETGNAAHVSIDKAVDDKYGDISVITWAQNDELMYMNLTRLFDGFELSEKEKDELIEEYESNLEEYSEYDTAEEMLENITHGVVEETTQIGGRDVIQYTLKDTEAASGAFVSYVDENGSVKHSNPANGYDVFSGEDGNVYVLWAQTDGAEQKIMISNLNIKDNTDGTYTLVWSDGVAVSVNSIEDEANNVKEYIVEPVGCVGENGKIYVAYNRFDIEYETETSESGNEVIIDSNRVNNNYWVSCIDPFADLSLENLHLSEEYPRAGEVFIAYADLENNGICETEEIEAVAQIIAKDESGEETVVQTVRPEINSQLIANSKIHISAKFEMTEEMINNAKDNKLDYIVRFSADAKGVAGEEAVAEADIYVGSKLVIQERNFYRLSGRDIAVKDGVSVIGDKDGTYRYIVNGRVVNIGNTEAENVKFSFEMGNKNAFDDAKGITPDSSMEEIIDYVENTPLNANVIHNENHTFYKDVGFLSKADKYEIAPGESGDFVLASKKISQDMYTENGYGTFAVEALSESDDTDNVGNADYFSDVLNEESMSLIITSNSQIVHEAELYKGQNLDLDATILPLDSSYEYTVKWESDNEAVVTVNKDGVVYANGVGKAKVTATIEGTEIFKTVDITVSKDSVGNGSSSGARGYYTVKFNSNGGNSISERRVSYGGTVPEPELPVKEGYVFEGWYSDQGLTQKFDFSTKVLSNLVLYAKWTAVFEDGKLVPFKDVAKDDWFYDDVVYVYQNSLMNGVSDDEFEPNSELTRAMLVTILYRNEGEPATNRSIPFADVEMDSWYANAVSWAKQNGIVNGVTETEFSPDSDITREQIATIMHRYAKYKGYDVESGKNTNILSYNDSDSISDYAKASLQWANGIGLINGKTESTLNPLDNATRAEAATIFYRFVKAN